MKDKENMKKLATAVSVLRYLAFVAVSIAAIYVIWKDLHNWNLMNKEHPQLIDTLGGLRSVWGPAYSFLLSAIAFPIGASFTLRNSKELSIARIAVECAYFVLAFYALSCMSDVVYYVYNPYHSGPAL